jgi:hypothetical protein
VTVSLFDLAAERLEHLTDFDRLESRGTLRLALKSAGLDPKSLDVSQLRVVFEKLMPGELETRGVNDAAAICRSVMGEVTNSPLPTDVASSTDLDGIFSRLGGD